MDNVKELLPYVNFVMMIVPSILAVVLASSARNLIGKGWLVAAVVITLVTRPVFSIMHLISNRYGLSIQQSVSWYSVLNLVVVFGTACFVFFLLSNWIVSRMKLDVKNLLFSFSGRIPRSVFWIWVCIVFPLGTWVGFAPLAEGDGFPKIVIWVISAGWSILSIWISIAVYTKRWHDCSKSGWMSLILLVPVIGFLCLGYLGLVRGTHGPNQYGEDPFNTHTT